MPAERGAMRDLRVIIRLKYLSSLTTSEIARRLGLARSTVRETLSRFESSDLIWPLPEGLSDEGLEAALYAHFTPTGAANEVIGAMPNRTGRRFIGR